MAERGQTLDLHPYGHDNIILNALPLAHKTKNIMGQSFQYTTVLQSM
jgi:hypothetical protein